MSWATGRLHTLSFLLGILGQELSLGIIQTPLSGNIAQNPGRELGRERWGAGGGGEGDLIIVTGLGRSVLPGFHREQSEARGASGVRSRAWHRQCLGNSDICRRPATTAVLPSQRTTGHSETHLRCPTPLEQRLSTFLTSWHT